jgi:hypothetical protein
MNNKITKKCEYCNKTFEVAKSIESKRFCSRKCYDTNRKEQATKVCPICKTSFVAQLKKQIYCSNKCKVESTKDRIGCLCNYCGVYFERIKSEVVKNSIHYCSNECRKKGMFWSVSDIIILKENYRVIPNVEIKKLLSKKWSVSAISRKANALKLGVCREWSEDEVTILKEKYSSVPMSEVMKSLPKRSPSSILGKAKTLGLLSYFYLKNTYSSEEDEFLKENYLSMGSEELAKELNRTTLAIKQRLIKLKLKRPLEISNYGSLQALIRQRLVPWRDNELKKNNYTCSLTGKYRNVVIHHCRGFNLLIQEVVELLDFPVHIDVGLYSQDEIDYFLNEFLQLQEFYGEYICISEDVHKLFHTKYGYGNNTIEQWNEFVEYCNKQIA